MSSGGTSEPAPMAHRFSRYQPWRRALRDKVYFAAGEAVLVALDAKTGREVWTTPVADNKSGL